VVAEQLVEIEVGILNFIQHCTAAKARSLVQVLHCLSVLVLHFAIKGKKRAVDTATSSGVGGFGVRVLGCPGERESGGHR
jgi:hypothetical protein